jgi:Redoxin
MVINARRARLPSAALAAVLVLAVLALAGVIPTVAQSPSPAGVDEVATAGPSGDPVDDDAVAERPEWFGLEMRDVRTGESFTIDDFAGQVVLLETMAVWCPTCQHQGDEVRRLHELLGNPDDLVSISLDIDMGEDEALLQDYVEKLDYDWRFAVAPLLVARALGNLYSAQYLNPPLSPMLIIDREGNVLGLPFGGVKGAEALQGVIEPLLAQ